MKQRSFVLAALAMMPFTIAGAQQTPPVPVTPATPAAPVVVPSERMRPVPAQMALPVHSIDHFDGEEIRRLADEARHEGQRMAEEGRRMADAARISLDDMRINMPRFSGQGFMTNVPFEGRSFSSPHVEIGVPPNFMQGDPADSVYSLARESFNRQDYSRAAARFAEVIAKWPGSRLVSNSAYYQAFSLYRIGTLETLRTALKVLEANASRFEYGSQYKSDAPALQARVLRWLAERNEPGADAKLKDLYAKYPSTSCDQEMMRLKSDALNSLYQSDAEAAMVYIRQHLATRDACNAKLRESAVFLLANRATEDHTTLIVQLAKNDTVRSVRRTAIEVLSRMPGDAAITALQQFMMDNDQQIQFSAVRSLMRSDNPKARAAMRALIDRRDAPERQRIDAIQSFDRDNTTPDDASYLRSLFNRQGESDRIKESVLSAISRVPTEENMAFLLNVAKNTNESSSLRSSALRRVTSRQNLATDDLIKLYDASDSRSMRNSLVEALGQRPETAAINKLLDIVKNSTDIEVRSNAIQILLRKKDPAITQKVLDLIK